MKGRVLLIDHLGGQGAMALVVDGRLDALHIDPSDDRPLPGAICRALPDRPMKGQGGMFVRLPGGTMGFLRQTAGVAPGRPLLVQIAGTAEPGKAVPVTTRLLFKSRFVIVTPDAPGLNLSRKLPDGPRRAALERLAAARMDGADATMGLILRSACLDAEIDAIDEDITAMRALAETVLADTAGAPELLVDGPGAHDLAFRDHLDPPPDDIFTEDGCLAEHGALDLIDALRRAEVRLEGGSMVLETTRALVAVDVNTGADTSPAAGLKVNIAAARDLPRQLRLRGLGGQVVVDFAPVAKRDRAILDQVLRAAFRQEGEVTLVGWTAMGLYELTRRRDRWPLDSLLGDLP
jgi:ribonuclease G